METVKFKQMAEGDREDYLFLEEHERAAASAVAQRLFEGLSALDSAESGYRVTRLEHSVQSATRAWRDGADEDWIVATLLHDIGDVYAPYNHDEYAAAVLRPYVREQCTWVVAHHGLFQRYYYAHHFGGDRNARKRHEGHPFYDDAVAFCERWDQASFDPDYESLPLDFFRPLVKAVFAREPYNPKTIAAGVRLPLADPATAARRRAKG
ncbi:HD domain-containing protein [Acuticoccus sp. I52.16.1]|uniref:HD domain-containing protein n=1 Tax=Acuticoccus sp. I52.16.1 TaxID=2928472 RepID=UPI001FD16503|nr:HD domain-containing protein [Acuticoccus sp. I52.16.1]UOM33750.1 HD domain-containing protein [Acuticoccus sp. I52.16.1]